MSNAHNGNASGIPPRPQNSPAPKRGTFWSRVSLAIQLILSLAVAGGILAYLIFYGKKAPTADDEARPKRREEVVTISGPRSIKVRAGTPLDAKLTVATVETAWLTAPVLPVTGTDLASLRSANPEAPAAAAASAVGLGGASLGLGPMSAVAPLLLEWSPAQDSWQFATPDLLSAFTDWEKAVVDVRFQKRQLQAVRHLANYHVEAQEKVVAQMEKLVKAGTERQKDLFTEQVNLKQFEIQGQKDTHEAENAVKVAEKTEAALARQLQQAGLEPTLLRSAAAEGEVVVAEVPERVISRVKLGMASEVRFFAFPNRIFTGKVSNISPVISKDKRVLNVQFVVKDNNGVLRPGMFAEIGLGTDKREALLIPADAVLHVGDFDYVLAAAAESGTWQITQVETGELRGANVEVLSGLKAGDRVLGKGAILLKPTVVQALQAPTNGAPSVQLTRSEGGKQ